MSNTSPSATKRRNDKAPHLATKWRQTVAMGVSPWKWNSHRAGSPEGTAGTATPIHVAPSGLWDLAGSRNHGFAPVATTCRPAGTNVLTPGRYVGAEEVEDDGVSATKSQTEFPATKWRHTVAMGVSPWLRNPQRAGAQGQLHGRTSFEINKEDNEQGRQVWFRCSDRVMRSERHFFTTLNYIHNNPVKHGYVDKWGEWAYSSYHWYSEIKGRDWLVDLWQEYPVLNYGDQWDVL